MDKLIESIFLTKVKDRKYPGKEKQELVDEVYMLKSLKEILLGYVLPLSFLNFNFPNAQC